MQITANVSVGAPLRLRDDLDLDEQQILVDAYARRRQYQARLKDWRNTAASRADHLIMLLHLVAEAHYQNPTRWSEDRCRELATVVKSIMQSAEFDAYGEALQYLAQQRLFESR